MLYYYFHDTQFLNFFRCFNFRHCYNNFVASMSMANSIPIGALTSYSRFNCNICLCFNCKSLAFNCHFNFQRCLFKCTLHYLAPNKQEIQLKVIFKKTRNRADHLTADNTFTKGREIFKNAIQLFCSVCFNFSCCFKL